MAQDSSGLLGHREVESEETSSIPKEKDKVHFGWKAVDFGDPNVKFPPSSDHTESPWERILSAPAIQPGPAGELNYVPLVTEQQNHDELNLIRVLVLHPGHRQDHIECSIRFRFVPLPVERNVLKEGFTFESPREDLLLKYAALSWSWGEGRERTRPVRVRHPTAGLLTLNVTQTLKEALTALRSPMEGQVFWIDAFWIDAICTNQDDNSEKHDQMSFMARIYSEAYKLIVWLGEETPASPKAFR